MFVRELEESLVYSQDLIHRVASRKIVSSDLAQGTFVINNEEASERDASSTFKTRILSSGALGI